MAIKRATRFTSWSYSRYVDFKLCPFKAKLKHLDKIQEPANDAMLRGTAIHKLAEDYIKGDIKRLPKELAKLKDDVNFLKKQFKKMVQGAAIEETWAFTSSWDRTTWNDWVKCWVRIKLDAAHFESPTVLVVTDWKTGKYRPDDQAEYLEQLELYALGGFLIYPHVETVRPRLGYLDHGIMYPSEEQGVIEFSRGKDFKTLQTRWDKRVKPMMIATTFPTRPNNKCRFCFYRKSNAAKGGGQCKF